MNPRILILAGLLLALTTAGAGAAPPDDIKLDNLNLGTYWFGQKVMKKDLMGKVVLVEIYGS